MAEIALPDLRLYWDFLSFKTLPVSGGTREQDPDILHAFRLINSIRADHERKERERKAR